MRAGDTLFVADLHLDAARPAVTALALRFLERARGAAALWIVGDLFELWLGDDVVDPAHEGVLDALVALATSGTALHLMHGNRDFLLGGSFATRVGATLHPEDECVVTLGGEPHLVLHGDTLCTADVDYQRLRATLRDARWQADFLARSPTERLDAARALRSGSREAVAGKAGGIMDVEPAAVAAAFARSGCATMIHGHTHLPGDHRTGRVADTLGEGSVVGPADRERSDGGEGVATAESDPTAGDEGPLGDEPSGRGERGPLGVGPDDVHDGVGGRVTTGRGRRRLVLGDWHDDHARYARHDGERLTLETWR